MTAPATAEHRAVSTLYQGLMTDFVLNLIAYNLVRIPKLIAA